MSSIKSSLSTSKVLFHQKSFSNKGHLPSKVIFHQRLSNIKGCVPSKVVLHQKSSSTEGFHPSKAFFHHELSSIEDRLPLKVHFKQIKVKGHNPSNLPSKVLFHQRLKVNILPSLSSIQGSLLSKGVFYHRLSSSNGCHPVP